MTEFLTQLLLVGGIVLLTSTLVFALSTWFVVRKVRRSGIVGRMKEAGLMRMRALSGDSSVRQLAKLRLELHRSTEATGRSLAAARSAGHPLGDLPAVAADLERAHRSLQESIRIAEEETNRQTRMSHAARFRRQADKLTNLSAQLRHTLLQLSDDVGTGAARQAGEHLKLELAGLQAWSTSYTSAPRNRTTA
ncbi:hypothetical protein [Arthrobacter castelli]|uniref:hypothetical protein n=1 Tax=Arthrobacter castelli TaxID=271431 RepID=UPI000479D16B|nr:hypothetical protein [Arthrobacter castelli]